MKGFKGHLQVDGNVSYESKGKEHDVILMHCLVHSRRKFKEALEYNKEKSSHALSEINKLYMIERQCEQEQLDVDQIHQRRQELSVPILIQLKEWLEDHYQPHVPTNPFQKAVNYMLKRCDGLTVYDQWKIAT